MEYIVFAVFMVIVIGILFVKELFEMRKKEKKIYNSFKDCYGQMPEREYKEEYYKSVKSLYDTMEKEHVIDDITWNDLQMDEVFKRMNYTQSSAGEEYLYYRLRTPVMEEETLKKEEEQIRYFMENDKERQKFMMLFYKIGRTGKYSIHKYIAYLDNLGNRSNLIHLAYNSTYVISILLLLWNTRIGIVCLISSMLLCMTQYYRLKKEIEPYLISFSYICGLIQNSKKLSKVSCEAFREEQKRLAELTKDMNGFLRFSGFVLSGNRAGGAGNPLDMVMDYLRMLHHIDMIRFNQMLKFARKNMPAIMEMLMIIGKMDMILSIGAYRASLQFYCIPEFCDERKLEIKEVYHPLIEEPVTNSICASRCVLLTGSNASGKSTFLKTVAINAILAQTIHTVLGSFYCGCFYEIYTSMALRDDLREGESYFIVEIKSMKRIIDAAADGKPVLCFVDEVLRGTNTVERVAASTCILKNLAKVGTISFAATHDIELTELLKEEYDNYHFEEEIVENDVKFNYCLLEGKATTRNAIKLLNIIGYDREIIQNAENMAQHFLEKGVWK